MQMLIINIMKLKNSWKGGILHKEFLIFVGDLNFTLYSCEVWCEYPRLDLLTEYFNQLFQGSNLINVLPCPFVLMEEW